MFLIPGRDEAVDLALEFDLLFVLESFSVGQKGMEKG